MPSYKTRVIERLFRVNWVKKNKKLRRRVMTQDDVVKAIRFCNKRGGKQLSDRNPANFMKDVVRGTNASRNWPELLKRLRITAVQRAGNGGVFEFIPYRPNQTEPFEDPYRARPTTPVFLVQSLSMLDDSKMLGRRDEAWLTQTAVNFRIVETHFALSSPLKLIDLVHLQMSLKLRHTEIDAMFMGRRQGVAGPERIAITCEAKQARERVLKNQLVEQAKAAFKQTDVDFVVPIAIRAVTGRGIYVAEFQIVERHMASAFEEPVLAAEALYELRPTVKGI